MKKILIIVFAVLAVAGISIPVVASGVLSGDIRVEEKMEEADTETRTAPEAEAWRQTEAVSPRGKAALTSTEEEPQTGGICAYYVDANGDGICDHCVGASTPSESNSCGSYIDANGDGFCDHCVEAGTPSESNSCGSYIDANGDGICDHCDGVNRSRQANRGSHHGGGHHR